jgi:hypothetical protein
MNMVRFHPEHAIDIIRRNSETGIKIIGVTPEEMIGSYTSKGSIAFTFVINRVPVSCGGVINLGWKRGEAWLLTSALFYKYRLAIIRAIKQTMPLLESSFNRIQAISVCDNEAWFSKLGFQKEGLLRCYGPAGQDCFMYSRVK